MNVDEVFLNRHHSHVFLFSSMTCAYDLSCGAVVAAVVHAAAVVHVAAAAAHVLVSNVDVASAVVVVVRVVVADPVDVVVAALMMFVSHPWRCVLVNPAIPNSHFSPSMLL